MLNAATYPTVSNDPKSPYKILKRHQTLNQAAILLKKTHVQIWLLSEDARMRDFVSPNRPRRTTGPPHLRVVENGFLKPATQNASARKVEADDKPGPGPLTAPNDDGMWE